MRRVLATAAATATAAGLALATGATAASASTTGRSCPADGAESLASVLLADGNQFDRNSRDFDIVTEAALAVLTAKPDSPVGVLTDGSVALTAFLPTDKAFKTLVLSLTGTTPKSERAAFEAVAGLGIDTVETVLLYHVVPGATITGKQAARSNGAELTTAQGGTLEVKVTSHRAWRTISLVDADPDARNARVIRTDINRDKDNVQIAHAVDRVLRPVNL